MGREVSLPFCFRRESCYGTNGRRFRQDRPVRICADRSRATASDSKGYQSPGARICRRGVAASVFRARFRGNEAMIIKSIEVRNFRKFVKPILIDKIDSGLTVIVGDNEEGKSTLLEALRTVVFVRYNISGDVAAGLLPYHSLVRPEIKLSFELHGNNYSLSKA